nr:LysR family transcriptional regulator [Ornithinimicrobium sp. F0845]
MRTLEAVSRLRSFAAAGEELGFTQSAVSQQIAELERRVGTPVVTRRPVRLTEAGQVLLTTETAITVSMSAAATELAALADGSVGLLRLGAFISAATSLVPPALAQVRAAHPGVRLVLREMEQGETHAALLRGDLDLAITFDYTHAVRTPPRGIREDHLIDDPILIVLPEDHPLATRHEVGLHDVPSQEWITTNVSLDLGVADLDVHAEQPVIPAALDFEGQDFRTALSLVATGLGVALLPRLALHHAPPGVTARPVAPIPMVRRIHTARLDTRRTPRAVQHLRTALQQAASALG